MLQNSHKTLGYKKNMVYKIPLGDGGGGKPYLANGLMYLVTFGYGLISLYYYLSLCLSLVILLLYVLFLLSCKMFYHTASAFYFAQPKFRNITIMLQF